MLPEEDRKVVVVVCRRVAVREPEELVIEEV